MTEAYTVYHRQIESHDPRLKRHVRHDSRSLAHQAELAPSPVNVYWASQGLPLNQLNIGKCTCEAACGRMNSRPAQSKHRYTDADSDVLYERETEIEGFPWSPENPTVNDFGGSGLTVCQAAKQLGWIYSYDHTFSLQDALRALALRPGITGIPWYDSMYTPDSSGLVAVSPGSQVAGGHEVLVDQVIVDSQLVGCWNSWGPQWGVGGRFYMTWDTWGRLLSEEGDVTYIHMVPPRVATA